MPTPAEVRTGNLEGALIQAFVDLLLQGDPTFAQTPQDMLDDGAWQYVSVSERDFKYAMAGYLILGLLEGDPGYSCTDDLSGPFTGENRALAACIDDVVAAIQVGDPGYDGTWQTLAPKANDFASVPHRVRRGCLIYCAWAYLDQAGGSATFTDAILAGCCCGTRGLYQSIQIIMEASTFPPPVSSDALLFGTGDQVTLEDGTNTLDNETTGAGEVLIGALTEATEMQPSELTYAVDDPAGSPLSRKITMQDVLDSMVNLTDGAATADAQAVTPIILDPSGTPLPRKVTLEALYQYLLTLGAILPDGFQGRSHAGTNTGLGSQAQFAGPGYWTQSGSSEVIINPATSTADMQRVYQNSRFWYSEMWTVMRQLAVTNWVGRTWNNSGALLNRWTYGWVSANIINSDLPTTPAAMFHTKYGDTFWRIQVHDGTSVTYDALTAIPIMNATNRYELKIEFTNTPSIIFSYNGSPILTRTTGLPNINTGAMYLMFGIGNSDPNAWIEIQKADYIIPNY